MKLDLLKTSILAGLTALITSACHTTAQAKPVPAVLKTSDEPSMQALKSVLAKAMNTSKVELGASDPTNTSTISVLPKSVIGIRGQDYANFALPTQFDLMMEGSSCYLVKQGTETKIMLEDVACRPFKKN